MKNITKSLSLTEDILIAILFTAMVVSIFLQVLNRAIFKIPSLNWTEELARYTMIAITMLGAEIGLRDGSQIATTGLSAWLPKTAQKVIDIFAVLVIIAFSSVVAVSTLWTIQKQIVSNQVSPVMKLPMYIPYLPITILFFVIAIAQMVRVFVLIRDFGKPETGGGEANG